MKLAQYITMIGNSSVSSRLFLPTKCQGTSLPRMTYSKVADPDFIRSGVIGRPAHGLMRATFAKLTTSARGKPPAQGSRPPEQSRTSKALCSLCALHLVKPKSCTRNESKLRWGGCCQAELGPFQGKSLDEVTFRISWILDLGIQRLMTTVAVLTRGALSESFTSLGLSLSEKGERMCAPARIP